MVETAPTLAGASTSMSAIWYQRTNFSASAQDSSATRLPFTRKDVVRDPGWPVCPFGASR